MDSSTTRTRKALQPPTIMQTLYVGLGSNAKLLDYLPKDAVVDVDAGDALTGYARCRIDFGSIKDTEGFQTKIFAYVSNSVRQRNLPEIHLRSRRTSHRGSKIFSFEEVMALRDVPAMFKAVKSLTSTPLKALTHCLFMLHGAPYPADSIIPQSFFTGLRDACYLYKIVADSNIHNQVQDIAPNAATGRGEVDVSLQSCQTHDAPAESPAPVMVITPSARKRSFSTFQGSLQMPHESTFAGTSPRRPAMSPLTPPTEVNSIPQLKVVTDAIRSASDLVSFRNPDYVDLQKRAVNLKIAIDIVNGKTLAQVGPQAHLTASTDIIVAKLLEYQKGQLDSLKAANKAERKALEEKHMAEECALIERNIQEHKAMRQRQPEANLAIRQKENALFEKLEALLKEAVGIQYESDRMLKESLTPDFCTRVHDTVRDQVMAEQMEVADDEAIQGDQE